MIVVAIIGILASIALPRFADLIRKGHEGATKGNLGTLRSALSIYYADMQGTFPSDDLTSLTVNAKYVAAIPNSYAANYHGKASTVENNDDWGMGAILLMDNGRWMYWNWDAVGGKSKGDLWVACTHTDSKGKVWTTY